MAKIGVGKDVLSYCIKCKLTLAHIVVAMKDENTIGKVTCNTCKATHAYKDPSSVKKRATRKNATKSVPIGDQWMNAINNTAEKSQAYSIKHAYALGDIIDHPKFGPGVVDKLIDGNKLQIIFRHEVKILMHNMK